jgi:hypothetical protein
MLPQLHTIESLSIELGYDRRTVSKALRGVPPDGEVKGRPAWHLRTAVKLLTRRNTSGGNEAQVSDIEQLSEKLQSGLDRASRVANVEKRRKLLREIGPLVGALDRWMGAMDGDDIVLGLLHREAIRDAVAQFLELWGGAPIKVQ